MKCYIGADLGTSALKLILTDKNGNLLSSATKEYRVDYPKPGWSEQSPESWWKAFCEGIRELLQGKSDIVISGIGVAGQMHGLVILDKNDNVIRPAILWNDGRTKEETEYLNTVIGKKKLSQMTANIAFAGFTAPKLLWLKNHEKESFDKIRKIMLPKDYINYRLTGVHITDYSDASGLLLLDVSNKCWSKEMLDICDVREDQMPVLKDSVEGVQISNPVAEELGISKDCIVVAGAGDNAGAAIGTGTVGEGKCNISLGTSGTIFISSDKFSVDEANALHSFCHADGGFHLMGCILSAASCNKWFCDEILKTGDYKKEQEKIEKSDLGNNHVFFLPYLMGERSPINDTDARGLFIGMRPDTLRKDFIQAVLEGVAFAIRENLDIAKKLGISVKKSTICGGGAKSNLWCEIMSNVLGLELEFLEHEEGPAFGVAMLAMTACGEYKDIKECAGRLVKIRGNIKPDTEIVQKYNKKYEKFKKIYPATKQLYKELVTEE